MVPVARFVILATLIFTLASGTESASCDESGFNTCMVGLLNARASSSQFSPAFDSLVNCLKDMIAKCPEPAKDELNKILKTEGVDLSKDLIKICSTPIATGYTKCVPSRVENPVFNHTDKECSDVEEVWSCSRKYFNKVKADCDIKFVTQSLALADKALTSKLDTCDKNGYHVTVDYKDGASAAMWSPIVTFVVSLATAAFLGLQRH